MRAHINLYHLSIFVKHHITYTGMNIIYKPLGKINNRATYRIYEENVINNSPNSPRKPSCHVSKFAVSTHT